MYVVGLECWLEKLKSIGEQKKNKEQRTKKTKNKKKRKIITEIYSFSVTF
jgi:hypothetical protein